MLAIAQMVVACGQTGDLYLPEDKGTESQPQTPPPAPAPVPNGEGLATIDDIPDASPGPISPPAEGL